MSKLNLLIADDSEEFSRELHNELQKDYHIFTCQDGREALSISMLHNPDVLVLDLMLPGLDGISLLHSLIQNNLNPMVMAVSRFYSDYALEEVNSMNVAYLMLKPCDARAAAARVRDLSRRLQPKNTVVTDAQGYVTSVLQSLGFRTKLQGFTQIRDAVLLKAQKQDIAMTKELYPTVGHASGHTGSQVERSIRTAIEQAWMHRNDAIWKNYFPADDSGTVPKMSNGIFLEYLAADLREKMR